MDPMVIESPVGDNSKKRERRRKQKERKKQAKNAAQIGIQTQSTFEAPKFADGNSEKIPLEKDLTTQTLSGNPKMGPGSSDTPSEGNTMDLIVTGSLVGDNSKRPEEGRLKNKLKGQAKSAKCIIQTHETLEDSKVANVNLEKIILEKDLTAQPLGGNSKMCLDSTETTSENKKPTNEADGNLESVLPRNDLTTQTIFGNPKDLGSGKTHSEGHMKKKRKKNMKKEAYVDEGKEKIDDGPTNNLVEGNVIGNKKRKQMTTAAIEDESQNKFQTGSTENAVEGYGTHKRKRKRNKIKEEANVVSMNVSSSDVKNPGRLCPLNAQIISTRRRKLLVLDLNGVLADIIRPPIPEEIRRRTRSMFGQAIFKRPFYYDFLKFCFENFDVGIWSSRSRKRVPKMVNYLLGDLKRKLVFCWDMTHVTPTGFQTIENRKKPLVLKELRKIWDFSNPRLGWEKGYYNESNTLLLDDSPYKALLNPVNTAIFPYSYCSQQEHDNSLGPGGELRIYLEGLLASENVQDYVERNPFGQSAITIQHPSWGFYEQVVNCVSGQSNKQK